MSSQEHLERYAEIARPLMEADLACYAIAWVEKDGAVHYGGRYGDDPKAQDQLARKLGGMSANILKAMKARGES